MSNGLRGSGNCLPLRAFAARAACFFLTAFLACAPVFSDTVEIGPPPAEPGFPLPDSPGGVPDPAALFREAEEIAGTDPEIAAVLYLAGLELKPADHEARAALAGILLEAGRFSEAVVHYERLWLESPSADVALTLSETFSAAGHFLSAALAAEAGANVFPEDSRLVRRAADAFEEAGLVENALQWLDKVLLFEAPGPGYWSRYAALAEAGGDWPGAARAWGRLLGGPQDGKAREKLERLGADHALVRGEILFFAPAGWEVAGDGFEALAEGRFVRVALDRGAETLDAFLIEDLPVEGPAGIEELLPEKWHERFLGGPVPSADDENGAPPEELAALLESLPPAPADLETLPVLEPPGTMVHLSIPGDSPFLPVSPQARLAWRGKLGGRPVFLAESGPPDFSRALFLQTCLSLAENAVVLPVVAEEPR